jgi:hypothetical protein
LLVATTPSDVLEALHRLLHDGRRPVTAERPRAPEAMRQLLHGDFAPHPIGMWSR